jgi:hypothetical protein
MVSQEQGKLYFGSGSSDGRMESLRMETYGEKSGRTFSSARPQKAHKIGKPLWSFAGNLQSEVHLALVAGVGTCVENVEG